MTPRSKTRLSLAAAAGLALLAGSPLIAMAQSVSPLQLYTLDCGTLELQDMGMFSDTGEHAGEPGVMAVPCYLIRHGDDWLLWDTGLGDDLAALPDGKVQLGGRWTVRRTLVSQLAELGLDPADIDYVALSHLHADHSGNIGLFPSATWLIPTEELNWGAATPAPLGVDAALAAQIPRDKVRPADGDLDVFGDGQVMILRAPGHTPGHRILLVRLPKTGPVLLSGDLFHTRENYERSRVPAVNVSRADTLASINRFAGLADHFHARVVVQHAPEDFAAMPVFPAALD